MLKAFIVIVGTFLLFSFIHYAAKNKKPFKRAFISMLIGSITLAAVDLFSGISGIYIPITSLSLIISTVGGVPGVAFLVLMSIL